MMSISRFKSLFGKGLLVGILGLGLSIGAVPVAQAGDDEDEREYRKISEVATVLCGFVNATNGTNVVLNFQISTETRNGNHVEVPCTLVLAELQTEGFKLQGQSPLLTFFADEGFGTMYTLTRKVKRQIR